jgi:hypothetical protein
MERIEVRADGLVADLFHDGSQNPGQAIVMLGGSEGGRMWSRPKVLLKALVGRGYRVMSLAYFKEPGLPRSLEEIPLEYFETAFDWLARQPQIVADAYDAGHTWLVRNRECWRKAFDFMGRYFMAGAATA